VDDYQLLESIRNSRSSDDSWRVSIRISHLNIHTNHQNNLWFTNSILFVFNTTWWLQLSRWNKNNVSRGLLQIWATSNCKIYILHHTNGERTHWRPVTFLTSPNIWKLVAWILNSKRTKFKMTKMNCIQGHIKNISNK
jgi:hypothetical protein